MPIDDADKIGALWEKTSNGGKSYMSGEVKIDGKVTKLVVFRNKKGDNPKRPDWSVYISKPQGQRDGERDEQTSRERARDDDSRDEEPF